MTPKYRPLWFGIAWLSLAPSLSAQTCVTAPKGLMGWWRGEGTVASHFDASPPPGVGVSHEVGKVGLGMRLQGAGAGVALGTPAWLDVQDFTIHAWVQRGSTEAIATDGSSTGWILSRGNGGLGFGIQADGKLRFGAMGGASWVESTATVADLDFHHVAVVRSGVSVTFFIDGVAAGGGTWPVVLAYGGTSALGRNAADGSGSFAGMLDEVAFVDRAQSVAQVAAVFGAGSAGLCVPPNDVPNDIGAGTERLVQGSGAVGHLVVSSDGFGIDGKLRLESKDGGYLSGVATTSGGLTNREGGTVSIQRGTEGSREIRGAMLNLGTWDVQWPLTVTSPEQNVVNRGPLDLTGRGALSLRGAGMRFDLAGGAVTGGNAIDGTGVTVRFLGGSLTGTPWLLGSRLEFDPRNTNAGSFFLTGSSSTLVGGLQPGQTVTVLGSGAGGHTAVVSPFGVRSSGTVRLSSVNGGYSAQLTLSGGRFVNETKGILETTRGTDGGRVLAGSLVNDGLLRVGWPLTVSGNGGVHEIRGTIEVQPGMTLAWRGPGQTYRQVGGQVQADGQFDMESMRFEYESGTMSGTIYLAGVDAHMHPTGEDPVALILAGSTSRLSGQLNRGQSIWIRGDRRVSHATVGFGTEVVNNGTVRLESVDGGYASSVTMPSGSFRNGPDGTLLVRRGTEGARTLGMELLNEGLVGVHWHAGLGRVGAVHRNRGTVSIAEGVTLSLGGGGQVFRQEAGLLDLAGGMELSGMTFVHAGGQTRGALYLDGVRLRIEQGSGPAAFNLTRSSSRLEGEAQPGQVVTILGDGRGSHTTVVAEQGFENRGLLQLSSAQGGYSSALSAPSGKLVINRPGGLIQVQRGTEGTRSIAGAVLNEGTVQVGWPLSLGLAGAMHVNRGTWSVEPGMTMTFPG